MFSPRSIIFQQSAIDTSACASPMKVQRPDSLLFVVFSEAVVACAYSLRGTCTRKSEHGNGNQELQVYPPKDVPVPPWTVDAHAV